MAKSRQINTIEQAIKAVTAALRLESIPNPSPEQMNQIHSAKCLAADIIDNSGIITAAQYGQDDITARIEAEEAAELAAAEQQAAATEDVETEQD